MSINKTRVFYGTTSDIEHKSIVKKYKTIHTKHLSVRQPKLLIRHALDEYQITMLK